MTKRRIAHEDDSGPGNRKGPSVVTVLLCALLTGAGLSAAFSSGAVDTSRVSSLTQLHVAFPESWQGMSVSMPHVLPSLRLGGWPAAWFGHGESTRIKSQTASPSNEPVIAIVIDDLGVDQAHTKEALALPAAITTSFLPYPAASRELSHDAHVAGHQVMVHLSMQPVGAQNLGSNALMVNMPPGELAHRVAWALSRVSDYEGANNHMGSRFTSSRSALLPVMQELSAHGVFFLDSRTTVSTQAEQVAHETGLLTGSRDIFLDDDESQAAVERQLERVEERARMTGSAIAIGHPHPGTLAALRSWTAKISERGFQLVPVSEVLKLRAAKSRSTLSSLLP